MCYHLRLKKALSYYGVVSATKKQPDIFIESKDIADKALATGYFELMEKIEEDAKDKTDDKTEQLEDMKIEDLKNIAIDKGIDITGFKKKTEYIEAIKALGNKKEEEDNNEVDYEDTI